MQILGHQFDSLSDRLSQRQLKRVLQCWRWNARYLLLLLSLVARKDPWKLLLVQLVDILGRSLLQ